MKNALYRMGPDLLHYQNLIAEPEHVQIPASGQPILQLLPDLPVFYRIDIKAQDDFSGLFFFQDLLNLRYIPSRLP